MTETITGRKSLSAVDTALITTFSERGHAIFTTRMAAEFLSQPPATVRKRLHRLARQRWLLRLEKGKYLIVPLSAGPEGRFTENELVIASHLIAPYYITYRTALSFYGYTEQPSRLVYIAATRRKSPLAFHGLTYRVITLASHKFFGLHKVWVGEHAVMMAEREKTIVDGLDHPEYAGGIVEIGKALWRGRTELDFKRMADYSVRMRNGAIVKRLGFLLERFDLGASALLEALQRQLSAGYARLDPLSPPHGRHNARWRVLVNLSEGDLLNWRET